jgi:hypothetical protein
MLASHIDPMARLASHHAASTSAAGSSSSSSSVAARGTTLVGRHRHRRPRRSTTLAPRATPSQQQQQQQQPPVGKMRGNIDAWHGADFPRGGAAGASGGAVPGARTVATPTLTPELAFERLLAAGARGAGNPVASFFSSELGGIVTNPGLAAVHADDHWLHSGHGAAERVPLCEGALYQLAPRLARLCTSARAVGVRVPLEPAALARVVLDTAAASRLMNGACLLVFCGGRGAGQGAARFPALSAPGGKKGSQNRRHSLSKKKQTNRHRPRLGHARARRTDRRPPRGRRRGPRPLALRVGLGRDVAPRWRARHAARPHARLARRHLPRPARAPLLWRAPGERAR